MDNASHSSSSRSEQSCVVRSEASLRPGTARIPESEKDAPTGYRDGDRDTSVRKVRPKHQVKGAKIMNASLIVAAIVLAVASYFARAPTPETEPVAEPRPIVQPLFALGEIASASWRRATAILDEAGILQAFRGELAGGQASAAISERVRWELTNGVAAIADEGETSAAIDCAQARQMTPSAAVIGDTIRIRFFEEPRVAQSGPEGSRLDLSALVFERLDLSESYAVDERGELSIPLLGRVDVVGRSLACVEQLVADRYRQAFFNTASVTASFETRHPVVVSGDVRSPGTYAVTPGMTVRHALALAGANIANGTGTNERISNLTARRFELDHLRVSLNLEISRIQAAMELRTTIAIDPELLEELRSVLGERRVASELGALAATVDSYKLEREDAKAHVEELALRLDFLRQQQSVAEAQIEKKRSHIERLRPLSEKGLTPLQHMQSEEQSEMDLERLQLGVSLDLAAARDAYNVARRDLELRASAFQSQLSKELREHLEELNSIESQITSVNMQIDVLAQGEDARSRSLALELNIRRQSTNESIHIGADTDTELFPGDILEVGVESVRLEQFAQTASDPERVN